LADVGVSQFKRPSHKRVGPRRQSFAFINIATTMIRVVYRYFFQDFTTAKIYRCSIFTSISPINPYPFFSPRSRCVLTRVVMQRLEGREGGEGGEGEEGGEAKPSVATIVQSMPPPRRQQPAAASPQGSPVSLHELLMEKSSLTAHQATSAAGGPSWLAHSSLSAAAKVTLLWPPCLCLQEHGSVEASFSTTMLVTQGNTSSTAVHAPTSPTALTSSLPATQSPAATFSDNSGSSLLHHAAGNVNQHLPPAAKPQQSAHIAKLLTVSKGSVVAVEPLTLAGRGVQTSR